MSQSAESLMRRIAALYQSNALDEAFDLAIQATALYPESSMVHTNLGFLLLAKKQPSEAREAYERALNLNPRNDEARRGLAVARRRCGEEVIGDSVSIFPYRGTADPLNVLALVSIAGSNLVTEILFDDTMRVTRLAVELHPLDAPLPPHDVAFSILGEADGDKKTLLRAQELLRGSAAINAPARILATGRAEVAQQLRSIAGVVTPATHLRSRAQIAQSSHIYPLLLRSPAYHTGEHFECVENAEDLARALAVLPGDELFEIEYLDTRDDDGLFVKYRVMTIDGRLYPLHRAVSEQWKVHYFSAKMEQVAAFREREASFLQDMEAVIGSSTVRTLEQIASALDLDYGGIDFTIRPDGTIVVFEANATMAMRYPPDDPIWDYRRPAFERAAHAVHAMIKSRARRLG